MFPYTVCMVLTRSWSGPYDVIDDVITIFFTCLMGLVYESRPTWLNLTAEITMAKQSLASEPCRLPACLFVCWSFGWFLHSLTSCQWLHWHWPCINLVLALLYKLIYSKFTITISKFSLPWQQGLCWYKFFYRSWIGRPRKPPVWWKQIACIFNGARITALRSCHRA